MQHQKMGQQTENMVKNGQGPPNACTFKGYPAEWLI